MPQHYQVTFPIFWKISSIYYKQYLIFGVMMDKFIISNMVIMLLLRQFCHIPCMCKKVKLSLCLTKHRAMKTYWGSGGIAPRILDLGTRWRWWSASRPGRFIPRKRAPGTHWIGGWVGPRTVLDVVVKRKIPSPHRESNPRTPIVQPVAQCYTDWAITALCMCICALKNIDCIAPASLIIFCHICK
jgi:hypothetical protein